MDAFTKIADIRLTSPFFVFLAPAFFIVFALGLRKKRGEVGFAALFEVADTGTAYARWAQRVKVFWVLVLVFLTVFVWMGPMRTHSVNEKNGNASGDLL